MEPDFIPFSSEDSNYPTKRKRMSKEEAIYGIFGEGSEDSDADERITTTSPLSTLKFHLKKFTKRLFTKHMGWDLNFFRSQATKSARVLARITKGKQLS